MGYPALSTSDLYSVVSGLSEHIEKYIESVTENEASEIEGWVHETTAIDIISFGLWKNIETITESIFDNETIRNFVYALSIKLYTVGSNSLEGFDSLLAGSIANGLTFIDSNDFLHADRSKFQPLLDQLPSNAILSYYQHTRKGIVQHSLTDELTLVDILNKNRHLIIVLLLMIFYETERPGTV